MLRRTVFLGFLAMSILGVGCAHNPRTAGARPSDYSDQAMNDTDSGSMQNSQTGSSQVSSARPRPTRRVVAPATVQPGMSARRLEPATSAARLGPPPQPPSPRGPYSPATPGENQGGQITALTGRIARKSGATSIQAWDAGSSDYLVLVLGLEGPARRHGRPELILRGTDKVSQAQLARLEGQQVRLTGRSVAGKPYAPRSNEKCPTDSDGRPLPRGSGFQVLDVQLLPAGSPR